MSKDDRDSLDLEGNPELAIPGLVDEARKFFRELLETNRALRLKAASQDERLAQLAGEVAESRRWQARAAELEQENARLTRELASLTERQQEVELEHQDVSGRFAQIEEQYVMLANLYVASYQLHATLKYEDVLRVVKEILANLVGVQRMRLFLRTKNGDLLLVAGLEEAGEGTVRLDPATEPQLAKTLTSGESYYRSNPGDTGPIASVPLRIRRQTVGVLVIDQLLAHKADLNATDGQLFDLLGGHVAVAIFRSRRAQRGEDGLPSGVTSLADDQVDLNELMLVT
jgi:hypothetical protein